MAFIARPLARVATAAGLTTAGYYLLFQRPSSVVATSKRPEPPKLRPLILSGPSGSGKSTLVKRLQADHPNCFGFSVSHTTRAPRPGEQEGVDYHFSTKEEMEREIAEGKFVESATFAGNMYGTSKAAVERVSEQGRICILDVDLQGVLSIRATDLNPRVVFIFAPSVDELERRLTARGTEKPETIRKRMEIARRDMQYVKEHPIADAVIVNDVVERAAQELEGIVLADIARVKQYHAELEAYERQQQQQQAAAK